MSNERFNFFFFYLRVCLDGPVKEITIINPVGFVEYIIVDKKKNEKENVKKIRGMEFV